MSSSDCAGCGACCQLCGNPPGDAAWLAALPPERRTEVEVHDPPQHSPCLWYDAEMGGCRHYDLRPDPCRDLAPGSDTCNGIRTGAGLVPLLLGGEPWPR